MIRDPKTPEEEAFNEGWREAEHRFERELDYLKGQITALQHQNEMIVKQMSAAWAFVPQKVLFPDPTFPTQSSIEALAHLK